MKEDEKAFFKTCVRYCSIRGIGMMFPRDIIYILSEFINEKRCWYLLEKWTNKGFYNYGVSLGTGWIETENLTGEYKKIFENME